MTSQVFYRKWRPQTLADVAGQEQVTHTLCNALQSGRISHAYLFCGPRGTGKTSTGRILAKAANCLTNEGKGEPCNNCDICKAVTDGRALDVIEIDAASNRGIDEIRELREKVNYSPNQSRYKVYIIDEVHMLTKEASNALLKTLEEPPPHVIFILATTEAHKILPTILSRCQRFDFRRISQTDVVHKLAQICEAEGISVEEEGLRLVARAASGSLRDAENLLQQLTTYYGTAIELKQVQSMLGMTGDLRVKELLKHITDNNISAGVATINSASSDGLDLRQFTRELVEYLRALLLIKTGSGGVIDLPAEDVADLKEIAEGVTLPQLIKAIKLFGQLEIGYDNYSTLPLELALVECSLPTVEPEAITTKTDAEPVRKKQNVVRPVPASSADKSQADSVVKKTEEAGAIKKKPLAVQAKPAVEKENTGVESLPVSFSTIEQLKLKWNQCIRESPAALRKTSAAALLKSAVPTSIKDNTMVLCFKFSIHKENLEKNDNCRIAEKIISGFMGQPYKIRCICEPDDNHMVDEAVKMGAQITDWEEK